MQKYVDRMLLAEYSPAGVIVDDALHVIQVRGETGQYLQIPPGEPTTDLTRMVRPGLLAALRSAIRKARQRRDSSGGDGTARAGDGGRGAGRGFAGVRRFAIRTARNSAG